MPDSLAPTHAVTCYTCLIKVWEGVDPPADGQIVLTEYADSTPGPECPSKVANCPHKTAARADQEKSKAATLGDLDALKVRLDKLEAT